MSIKNICFIALAALTSFVWAQEEEKPPRSEAGQLRLELTNALIKEIKSTKEVRYRVKWHYLPDLQPDPKAHTIIDLGNSGKPEIDEYVISNKEMRGEDMGAFINSRLDGKDEKEKLKWKRFLRALSDPRSDSQPNSLQSALDSGYAYWSIPLFDRLFADTRDPIYSDWGWHTMVTAQQSFFAMYYLLGKQGNKRHSYGAGMLVEATPDPRGKNPLVLADELTWHIQLKESEETLSAGGEHQFYNFTAYVLSSEIRQTLRNAADLDEMKVDVVSGMLRPAAPGEEGNQRYRIAYPAKWDGAAKTVPIPEGVKKLEEFNDELGASVGSFTLGNIAGQSTSSLLAPLFENDSDASPFYGSLIGGGRSAPMYGLNYILSPQENGSLGFLYGFVSNSESALFLGPSLSFGPFTLSAGARIFNGDDDEVTTRFSGALSIDLGQLFGRNRSQIVEPKKDANISFWAQISREEQLVLLAIQGGGPGTTFNITKDDKPYGTYISTRLAGTQAEQPYQAFTSKSSEVLKVHAPPGYKIFGVDDELVSSSVVSITNEDDRVFTHILNVVRGSTRTVVGEFSSPAAGVAFAYRPTTGRGHRVRFVNSRDFDLLLNTTYVVNANPADQVVVKGSNEDAPTVILENKQEFTFSLKGEEILIKVGDADAVSLGSAKQPVTMVAQKKPST